MKTRLSDDLKWLAPYLKAVRRLVPLNRVISISYYQTRSQYHKEHHKAITHRLGNNKNFQIFIRTKLPVDKRIPLRYYDQEDVLFFLGHELAHTKVWDHTTAHLKLTGRIFKKFTEVAVKLGFEQDRCQKTTK